MWCVSFGVHCLFFFSVILKCTFSFIFLINFCMSFFHSLFCYIFLSRVFCSKPAHSSWVFKLGLNFIHIVPFFNYLSWLKMALYRNEDLVIIHPQSDPKLNQNFHSHIKPKKRLRKALREQNHIYDFIRHTAKSLRDTLIGNKLKQNVLRTSIRFLLNAKTFIVHNNPFLTKKGVMRMKI